MRNLVVNSINFNDFTKMEIKVGKILEAVLVSGSNKLIKMKVDIGEEERNLVAGIAQYYSLENLIGKTVIVLVNLEPKTIFGIESQGMLLASIDGENVSLLQPDKDMKIGSVVG